MPGLPSLELVAETVEAELAAQERRGDALDSKAGVLLGFAGVLVGLSVSNLDGTLATIGAALAGAAAVLAGLAFIPRSFPTLKLRPLSSRYLTAGEDFGCGCLTLGSPCSMRRSAICGSRRISSRRPRWPSAPLLS